MKETIEIIVNNIQYVYPGLITLLLYYRIIPQKEKQEGMFILKDICISYIMVNLWGAITGVNLGSGATYTSAQIILTHAALILTAIILAFVAAYLITASWINSILEFFKVPIDSSENLIMAARNKCPAGHIVFATIYQEKFVYTGVLHEADPSENGFYSLKRWRRFKIGDTLPIEPDNEKAEANTLVIPVSSVQTLAYQYIPMKGSLPKDVEK